VPSVCGLPHDDAEPEVALSGERAQTVPLRQGERLTIASGNYSVNSDCTGSFSIAFQDGRPPVTVNFVVATGGLEIDTVVVGVCIPPNSSPPCTGQGVNSIGSIGKKRFLGFRD